MTELRRKGWGGLVCAADKRLDIGDNWRIAEALETVGGILWRGGGLQRRSCLLGVSLGGPGESLLYVVGVWERLTEGSGRRRHEGSIS